MKCPKCGYLGFEQVDRCRNCGYDFSLTPALHLPDLTLHEDHDEVNPLDDLALVDAGAPLSTPSRSSSSGPFTPNLEPLLSPRHSQVPSGELPLFGLSGSSTMEDAPLITKASPPRAPLAVRRATPEVPRLRSSSLKRAPILELSEFNSEASLPVPTASRDGVSAPPEPFDEPAGLAARMGAAAIDLAILAGIDAVVIYFTMKVCGLTVDDLQILPKGPLVAFLVVQNLGYLVAFTIGGQTLGKMAVGIKVVSADADASLDLGHAILRTLVWVALAVPAGLGFLTTLFSDDHRGLHDRCAGTKVVRASA